MNPQLHMTTATSRSQRRRRLAGLSALPFAALIALASPVGAAPPDKAGGPPGNNGTVKIDGETFDTHPDNEPHVGCVFQVDFYGFDEGDLTAKVTFTVQPPTGKRETLLIEDNIDIGEDDNRGGGSEAGLDAEKRFDLTDAIAAGGYSEHPQQGYHVTLTVNAEGSQGADTKHKVFWVEGCAPVTNSNPSRNPNANPSSNPNANPSANPASETSSGVAVLGESITKPATAEPGATVAGETLSRPAPSELARTGSPIGISLLLAAIALSLGAAGRHFGKAKTAPTLS
jgi:hypothetical protein